jgi:hypothetical protein
LPLPSFRLRPRPERPFRLGQPLPQSNIVDIEMFVVDYEMLTRQGRRRCAQAQSRRVVSSWDRINGDAVSGESPSARAPDKCGQSVETRMRARRSRRARERERELREGDGETPAPRRRVRNATGVPLEETVGGNCRLTDLGTLSGKILCCPAVFS